MNPFKSFKSNNGGVYRFQTLAVQTIRTQNGVRTSKELLKQLQAANAGKAQIGKTGNTFEVSDIAKHLLYSGLDFKGQVSMAVEAASSLSGLGGGAAVNPAGVVGLNAEVNASAGLMKATQRSVVVLRGPSTVELEGGRAGTIDSPISINSFKGALWSFNAQLGLEFGAGGALYLGRGVAKGGGKLASLSAERTEASSIPFAKGLPGISAGKDEEFASSPLAFELASVQLEMKAGFKLEGSYEYDHYFAENPGACFGDPEEARTALEEVLKEGSLKTLSKKRACEFINSNSVHFGGKTIHLHPSYFWGKLSTTTGTAEIVKILEKYAHTIKSPEVAAKAQQMLQDLRWLSGSGTGYSFLRMSSHKSDGAAGLFATASAEGSLGSKLLGGGRVGAELFFGMKCSGKKSVTRFQTYWRARSGNNGGTQDIIHLTYDTQIKYSQVSLGSSAKVEVKAKIGPPKIGEKDLINDTDVGEKLQPKEAEAPDILNRMSYQTAIIVWKRPSMARMPLPAGGSHRDLTREGQLTPLKGTGIAIGQSYVVRNLRDFYAAWFNSEERTWCEGADAQPYVRVMAESLSATPAHVLSFLGDAFVHDTIVNWLPPEKAVLLEAAHRLGNPPQLPFIAQRDWAPPNVRNGRLEAVADELWTVHLKADAAKLLFEAGDRVLESIRLRYRKHDVTSEDPNLWSPGFRVAGNGLQIKLLRLNRASSDGIADLCTVFLDSAFTFFTQTEAYEEAVPPAVLFCQ